MKVVIKNKSSKIENKCGNIGNKKRILKLNWIKKIINEKKIIWENGRLVNWFKYSDPRSTSDKEGMLVRRRTYNLDSWKKLKSDKLTGTHGEFRGSH